MSLTKLSVRTASCMIALSFAASASAVVTSNGYYRLGETEGGVSGNATSVPAQDASGNNNHYTNDQSGNFYTSNVSFAAQQATLSSIGVSMNGSSGGFYGITSAFPTTNAGVELFVETNDANKANNFLAGTGNNTTGIGLSQNGTIWQAKVGSTFFGSVPVKTDQWVHLAVVNDSGTNTFYVNGVPRATNSSVPPAVAAPHMGVIAGGSVRFGGTLDEVRMFSFTAGSFDPADLLINQNLTPDLDNGSFENLTAGQANFWNGLGNVGFVGAEGTSDGSLAAVFNGAEAAPNGELMQTLATTPGKTYDVSFDFGKYGTATGDAELTVDVFNAFDFVNVENFVAQDSTGTLTPGDVLEAFEFSFVALDDWTTLRFTDTSSGTISFDAVLDNVSVSAAVPEPVSIAIWSLFGLGLAALGYYRVRAKR